MDSTTIIAVTGIIGTVVSAALASLPAFLSSREQRRLEARRQLFEIAFRFGLEYWKSHLSIAITKSKNIEDLRFPLDLYVIHTFRLAEFIDQGNFDEGALRQILQRNRTLFESVWGASPKTTRKDTARNNRPAAQR